MDFTGRHMRASVRTTLILDSAFEFVAGAALIVFAGTFGDWLAIGATACMVLGVVFLAAGVAIAGLARSPDPGTVRALAYANIAGGAGLWVAFFAAWSALAPGGRFVLGAAADAFILIGILELLAISAQRRPLHD